MSKWPEGYLTTGRLKERGWTDGLIKKFLPEPDMTMPNRVYRSKPPYRLYSKHRVADIESTGLWKQAAEIASSKRQTALRAVETKRQSLLKAIANLNVRVPVMPHVALVEHACNSYNSHKLDLLLERGYEYTPATKDSDGAFLERIMVNYIRHCLTDYEFQLSCTYGRVGVRQASFEIQRKVYEAIAMTYPQLGDECMRQLNRKASDS